MKHFYESFMAKLAASVIGVMPGVTSGLRSTKAFGVLRGAQPKSNMSIGPRSTPNLPPISKAENVKVPKPHTSYREGASSTKI